MLGINYCWLTANGKMLYQYQIEKFNFDQGRYIYTHTDPYLKWKENKTYIRLFKESFNPLPYYKQNQNGEITLDEFNLSQLNRFNLIDLNSDGTITEAEFLKSISNRFDKMDLNSDEVLKKKEIRKALRKIKKQEKRLQDNQKKQPKPFIKQ